MTRYHVAALVCFATLSDLGAADWPQYRGPLRDGVSTETGLLKDWPDGGPKLLWTFAETGLGYSGSAIVGDRLYTCGARGDSEFVIALDLKVIGDGKPRELWATRIGNTFTWKGNNWNLGPNATPTVDGELLFALGGGGDLVCVESATGKERWRKSTTLQLAGEVNPIGGGAEDPIPLGWGHAWAPLVDGDKLICVPGGSRGLFAALDKRTGEILWRSHGITDQTSYSSPLAADIGGIRQYIQVTNTGIHAVAAKDGKLLWSYKRSPAYDDVVIATPIVADNRIFSSVGFEQGCDLIKLVPEKDEFKVEKIVSNRSIQNRDGGMVRVGDHVYGYSENRGWFCMEFSTGNIRWEEKRKLGRGSLVYADGHLYCCAEKGGIVVRIEATSAGWSEKGRFKLPSESKQRRSSGGLWTHPVIANGRLYVRDQELLFCFDLKP